MVLAGISIAILVLLVLAFLLLKVLTLKPPDEVKDMSSGRRTGDPDAEVILVGWLAGVAALLLGIAMMNNREVFGPVGWTVGLVLAIVGGAVTLLPVLARIEW